MKNVITRLLIKSANRLPIRGMIRYAFTDGSIFFTQHRRSVSRPFQIHRFRLQAPLRHNLFHHINTTNLANTQIKTACTASSMISGSARTSCHSFNVIIAIPRNRQRNNTDIIDLSHMDRLNLPEYFRYYETVPLRSLRRYRLGTSFLFSSEARKNGAQSDCQNQLKHCECIRIFV